jgi:hypothetical protein
VAFLLIVVVLLVLPRSQGLYEKNFVPFRKQRKEKRKRSMLDFINGLLIKKFINKLLLLRLPFNLGKTMWTVVF